jgi:hypothetical protein
VYNELEGDGDFEEEGLLEWPFREGFGRTTTSRGSLDDLIGIRVMVGPMTRWRELICFFLSLLELEAVLLLVEQFICFLLPQLGHGEGPSC